jgi:hypothetical protein
MNAIWILTKKLIPKKILIKYGVNNNTNSKFDISEYKRMKRHAVVTIPKIIAIIREIIKYF